MSLNNQCVLSLHDIFHRYTQTIPCFHSFFSYKQPYIFLFSITTNYYVELAELDNNLCSFHMVPGQRVEFTYMYVILIRLYSIK